MVKEIAHPVTLTFSLRPSRVWLQQAHDLEPLVRSDNDTLEAL